MKPPVPYIKFLLEEVLGKVWRGRVLSRQSINEVLKEHNWNGSLYRKDRRDWNFFRADSPNDLWQMDIKDSFRIENQSYYALIVINGHSGYIINCSLRRPIKTPDITFVLFECIERCVKPSRISVDNDTRFKTEIQEMV